MSFVRQHVLRGKRKRTAPAACTTAASDPPVRNDRIIDKPSSSLSPPSNMLLDPLQSSSDVDLAPMVQAPSHEREAATEPPEKSQDGECRRRRRNHQAQLHRRMNHYKKCYRNGLGNEGIGHIERIEEAADGRDPDGTSTRDEASVSSRSTQRRKHRTKRSTPRPHWMIGDGWTQCLPFLLLCLPSFDRCAGILQQHQPTVQEAMEYARTMARERDEIADHNARLEDRFKRFVRHTQTKRQEWEQQIADLTARNRNKDDMGSKNQQQRRVKPVSDAPAALAASHQHSEHGVGDAIQSKENISLSKSNEELTSSLPGSWNGKAPKGNLQRTGVDDPKQTNYGKLGESLRRNRVGGDDHDDDETVVPPPSKKHRRVTASPGLLKDTRRKEALASYHPDPMASHTDPSNNDSSDGCNGTDLRLSNSNPKVVPPDLSNKPLQLPGTQNTDMSTSLHRLHVHNPFSRQKRPTPNHKENSIPEDGGDSQTIIPPPSKRQQQASIRPAGLGENPQQNSARENDSHTVLPPFAKQNRHHPDAPNVDARTTDDLFDDSQTILPPRLKHSLNADRPTETASKSSNKWNVKKSNPDGWINTRLAKDFVAEAAAHNRALAASRRAEGKKEIFSNADTRQPQPFDSPQKTPTEAPYIEVVRNKAERAALKPHQCEECGAFMEGVLAFDDKGVYNRQELMCCSRHRHRFTPPETPEGFWELSFHDEVQARKRAQEEKEMEEGLD